MDRKASDLKKVVNQHFKKKKKKKEMPTHHTTLTIYYAEMASLKPISS